MFGTGRAAQRPGKVFHEGHDSRILAFGQWLGAFGLMQGV